MVTTEENISCWLRGIVESETIPADIKGINFGLFEQEGGGYCLYMIGSKEYDPDDDDWACDEDYQPVNKYFPLSADSVSAMNWQDALNHVFAALKNIFTNDPAIINFFGDRAITTGFDDGDLYRIR